MACQPLETDKQFDVLGLGAVAVDDLIYVESYPPADTKVPVLRSERHCGGLTGNAMVAASRLGARCGYAGILGTDSISDFAVSKLQAEGVDLSYARRDEDARTIHSFVVVDVTHGTRNVFSDRQGFVGVHLEWPPPEAILSTKVLLVDHIAPEGMNRAVCLARANGIPVVADIERISGPAISELITIVDHLIISSSFAQKLSGEKDPVRAVLDLWSPVRSAVVITCGAKGCWWVSEEDPKFVGYQPAFQVKAVDTTGCGDVFHGAYAAGLSRGLKVTERIRLATAAAALKATQTGQNGIPDISSVESLLNEGVFPQMPPN